MYLPKHFAEHRLEVLHGVIRRAEFATLVTSGRQGIMATHLPVVLDPAAGPRGTLTCHVARGNPQWQDAGSDSQALVIFLGPEAYISPSWYPTKQETGRVVPTWNYLAVHAYGPLRTFEDPSRLRAHVERLTTLNEMGRPEPWQLADAPESFVEGLLKGIVGLEIPIERLEGKWKMSQNRPESDRLGTIQGLLSTGRSADQGVADVMQDLEAQRERT